MKLQQTKTAAARNCFKLGRLIGFSLKRILAQLRFQNLPVQNMFRSRSKDCNHITINFILVTNWKTCAIKHESYFAPFYISLFFWTLMYVSDILSYNQYLVPIFHPFFYSYAYMILISNDQIGVSQIFVAKAIRLIAFNVSNARNFYKIRCTS